MIFNFLFSLLFLLNACGSNADAQAFLSLSSLQPELLSLQPSEGESLIADDSIHLELSRAVDSSTVTSESVVVERILQSTRVLVEGTYQSENNEIVFTPQAAWKPGLYEITLNNKLLSEDKLPFKGSKEENYLRFVSHFSVPQNLTSPSLAPENSPDEEVEENSVLPQTTLPRPTELVINELLYDVPGSDSDGQIFLELYGTPQTFIDDYSVHFINGDGGAEYSSLFLPENSQIPADGLLVLADASNSNPLASHVTNADLIFDFDPQNGPDCVQLLDENGELVDVLAYGAIPFEFSASGLPCAEADFALDVGSGLSLSRVEHFDSDNNANDFLPLELPSPGEL